MAATELSKSMNEFLTKLQDDLKEAMNTMMCTKCEGKHKYVDAHLTSLCQPEAFSITHTGAVIVNAVSASVVFPS